MSRQISSVERFQPKLKGNMGRLTDIKRWVVDYSVDVNPGKLSGKFPLVILDPGCKTSVKAARDMGVKVLGYTAWTEIADDSRWRSKFESAKIKTLGRTEWDGDYVNILDPRWHSMFLNMVGEIAGELGWDGIFIDVYDGAVDLGGKFGFNVKAGVRAGSDILVVVREEFPETIIMPNRGFEQWGLDQGFRESIDGMLVERVLTGEDLNWLKEQLFPIRDAGIPIFALDYCKDEAKAKKIVQKNKGMGFIPLVTATSSLSPPKVVGYSGKWS